MQFARVDSEKGDFCLTGACCKRLGTCLRLIPFFSQQEGLNWCSILENTHFPLVHSHPGLFHAGADVHFTASGPPPSTKLNLDRQRKARDTSTMPHPTQKVNDDVGRIRTELPAYQLWVSRQECKTLTQSLPLLFGKCVTRKNFVGTRQVVKKQMLHNTSFPLESEEYELLTFALRTGALLW